MMAQNGKGELPDQRTLAAAWFQKATEQEDPEAQFNMGGMCLIGMGMRQDDKEAAVWFRKAAEQGHPSAPI